MSQIPIIRLKNLSKAFGRGKKRVQAVMNVSLEIEAGQVYGFLGPNGAGKTTTIRLLLDLIRPDQGDAYIYGRHVRREHGVLQRVGSIVEDAAFYPFLSGRRNLEVIARTGNFYHPDRITTLLEQLGLAEAADRRVKGYSTGMKQRLGLATALLNDPDLLILDEPTNGLDPAGIQEVRHFIRELVEQQGKTIFLSSHILAEVEQVCDRVAIINKGEIVREGAVKELLAGQAQLRVEAAPLDKATAVLGQHWTVTTHQGWLLLNAGHEDAPQIVQQLVEQQVHVYQVTVERRTLEDYFLAVTQEKA